MVVELSTTGDPRTQGACENRFVFGESLLQFLLAWLPVTLLPPVAIMLALFLVVTVAQVSARDSILRLLCLVGLFPLIIVAFAIGASISQSRLAVPAAFCYHLRASPLGAMQMFLQKCD